MGAKRHPSPTFLAWSYGEFSFLSCDKLNYDQLRAKCDYGPLNHDGKSTVKRINRPIIARIGPTCLLNLPSSDSESSKMREKQILGP